MQSINNDTITALATPPGRGGISIIRVSGPKSFSIAKKITKKNLINKQVHYGSFFNEKNEIIDKGITLFFKNPESFTGEDVIEFQMHGGPIIVDWLLNEITQQGARLALPGEFSERAYLNGKMDLTQAEAIADLINSSTDIAAKSALQSLQGAFSKKINTLVEKTIHLRVFVEAAIDFPEEEVDFLSDGKISALLNELQKAVSTTLDETQQGVILQEGITLVIAGKPNAGKSSLLNQFSGKESAIVTEIEGTTRDILKEHIQINGIPIHIIDTAGLRDSDDIVEKEGIKRATKAIEEADHILLVIDAKDMSNNQNPELLLQQLLPNLKTPPLTVVINKADKYNLPTGLTNKNTVTVSAKTGDGLDVLKDYLSDNLGYKGNPKSIFSARRRHINLLKKADKYIKNALIQLHDYHAGELVAEDLRVVQEALGEITGAITSDEFLGEIFSSFCIGK